MMWSKTFLQRALNTGRDKNTSHGFAKKIARLNTLRDLLGKSSTKLTNTWNTSLGQPNWVS